MTLKKHNKLMIAKNKIPKEKLNKGVALSLLLAAFAHKSERG